MNIILWIVFGLVIGFLANALDPRPSQGGMIGALILGIGGALVGGLLANVLLGIRITGFDLPSFFVATLGAILLLMTGRAIRTQ